jgi:polyphosphate kinase
MAMTLSPGHPLPHLPHLTLALAVVIRRQTNDRLHLAEVELPAGTARFLSVPGEAFHFIQVEEVIRSNLDLLYPDALIDGAYVFRVTRGGDLALDEDSAADLLDAVSEAASRRPRNPAIRLEVESGTPGFVRELLLENLRRELGPSEVELEASDVQEIDGLIDLRGVDELPLPDAPGIRYPEFRGTRPVPAGRPMVETIRERDLLYHHPFDSFASTVIRFIDEAAADPDVTAKDHPLSHRRSVAGGREASRGVSAGKAGGGIRRAKGAVRGGTQHRVGAKARERGRARGVRTGGVQESREGLPGGAP